MTDSDPSDSELYSVMVNQDLYHGSVWGSDAAHKGLKKHFSGRDAVRERVDAVPVEALQELHSDLLNTAQQAGSGGHYETANVVESFAEDVEALIDDYSYE
jgi:hypothetical protein